MTGKGVGKDGRGIFQVVLDIGPQWLGKSSRTTDSSQYSDGDSFKYFSSVRILQSSGMWLHV